MSLMVLGTGSHAGKSVLAAGLCRILSNRGWRVAPFKAQNMSLNSGSTFDGHEIARAQIVQCEAARCLPSREMNPVLLKPLRGGGSQVLLLGKSAGLMATREYFKWWPKALAASEKAYQALCEMYEAVILEGAGSPAEVNLRHRDLANLEAARFSGAPWILACDIERGGAFASVIGTLQLLPAFMRRRFAGVVFNKFRGDPSLLDSGLRWLKKEHGIRTLGVLPWLEDLGLEEEDSLGVPKGPRAKAPARALRVEVMRHSSMANFNDLQPLVEDPALELRWKRPREKSSFKPDLVVIPGNRSTLRDMQEVNQSGEAARLKRLASEGTWFLGICGGLQMLGKSISDPHRVDGKGSPAQVQGLGLLDAQTSMDPVKIVSQTECKAQTPFGRFPLKGYEIHHGRTRLGAQARESSDKPLAGRPLMAQAPGGRILAGYLHGILDNEGFRSGLLKAVSRDRGRAYSIAAKSAADPYDRWAGHLEKHVGLEKIPGFLKRRA